MVKRILKTIWAFLSCPIFVIIIIILFYVIEKLAEKYKIVDYIIWSILIIGFGIIGVVNAVRVWRVNK